MAEDNTNAMPATATPPVGNPLGGIKPAQRPVLHKGDEASATTAIEQLKNVTQKLKDVTQPIPQQAILRTTGVIGAKEMSDAQREAAKSRTARISLSEAIGAASVREEAAPMKTIRIKRPVGLSSPTAAASAPAGASVPAAPAAAPAATADSPTITQRKTLKIARPAAGARPVLARPGAASAAKPAAAKAEGEEGAPAPAPVVNSLPPPAAVKDLPTGLSVFGLVIQIAACIVIGITGYLLYQNSQMPLHCGGLL